MKVGWVGDDTMRGNIGLDRSKLDACCKEGVTSVIVEVVKYFNCSVIPGR